MYNLATAAAAVGRNKNAILRAIEAGKIPVSQDANGDMLIDPADLHHLYPPLRTDEHTAAASVSVAAADACGRIDLADLFLSVYGSCYGPWS